MLEPEEQKAIEDINVMEDIELLSRLSVRSNRINETIEESENYKLALEGKLYSRTIP
jgi:hypothetical protein